MNQPLIIRVDQYAWTKSFKKLEKAFDELKKESLRDVRKILVQQARLFCIDLIHVTQPYGKGTEAKKTGENAVKRDIKRVYITAADLYDKVNFQSEQQAKYFYALMQKSTKKNLAKAKAILRSLSVSIDPIEFDGGDYHKSKRDRKGHVNKSTKPKLIDKKSSIKKYTREVVKRVGTAKGGFAAAALDLSRMKGNNGNVRGIPAWAKKQAQKSDLGSAKLIITPEGQQTVIIINKVKYIKNLVGKREILKAMEQRARSMARLAKKVIELNAQAKVRKKLLNTMTAGL